MSGGEAVDVNAMRGRLEHWQGVLDDAEMQQTHAIEREDLARQTILALKKQIAAAEAIEAAMRTIAETQKQIAVAEAEVLSEQR